MRRHKKNTLLHTHTDRQGNMFEGRGATLGNGFIFVERNAAAKKLDQVALCHSENVLTFRDYLATSACEVRFSFAKYFVVMQAISQKT